MRAIRFAAIGLAIITFSQTYDVQAQTLREAWEMLNLIRKEKFDIVLPKVMKEHNIDMWIHVIRHGNPDPLEHDLGGTGGYFIFTDKGSERIERAVLGGGGILLEQSGAYDVFGSSEHLRQFVSDRNPKRIAVNMSDWISASDGLSHTDYLHLTDMLGDTYTDRLTSADHLITDFRAQRVSSEIVFYAKLGDMTRDISERALSNEVITPGVTTLEDVAWWMKGENILYGHNYLFRLPSVAVIEGPEGVLSESDDRIIKRGDLLKTDFGVSMLNYGTDIQRMGYVLREGESSVPHGFQNAFDQALKARAVIRRNIIAGRTAGKTLENLEIALEEAGFGFILEDPAMDGGYSGKIRGEHLKFPDKTEISVDLHALGNTGSSELAVGPSIANFRPDRAHLTIHPNNFFSFEFMAYTAVPEWGGKKVRIGYEDNAIVTENGVEWLYPPADRISIIR